MITRTSDLDLTRRSCVVFDFDGTLADTKPAIVRTASAVLLGWGIPKDEVEAKVGQLIGPPFPEAFSMVFGVSESDAEEITRRYRSDYFTRGVESWPLFPGIKELLKVLKAAGKHACVASSKVQAMIDRGVDDNDIRGLLDASVGRSPGVLDTKEEAILASIAQAGCTPSDAVMVGDRFHDVEGAAACGMPCIGVLFGDTGTRRELEDAGAVAVVDTVDELTQILLGNKGA